MDDHGFTCKDARGSLFVDTHTCGNTSKDARGSTCTDDCGSAFKDVSTYNTDVHRITCLYISNKGTGVHGVTSAYDSTVNMVVCVITNVYDEYGRCKPIWYIGTDVVGKL